MENSDFERCWADYEALMRERPEQFAPSAEFPIVTSKARAKAFAEETGLLVGVVYRSSYTLFLVDLIDDGGPLYTYERVLPASERGAVVAVVSTNDKLILLRQYRHALRNYQWSFPRGFGEVGISSEENVRKELAEEINASVVSMRHLGRLVADSGLSGTTADVFHCQISGHALSANREGIVEIHEATPLEVEEMIAAGKITDGFTVAAYFLYAKNEFRI
ncbi:MAG: NUDIX hydrolase [Nevskiaceae bacterium]|jgi:ADP-ribose pyrophosphatase|nr:NUDIX hydrolase [Nevskiaceae bacterium]